MRRLSSKYDVMMDWLARLYVNTLNAIQYMHDKYFYEAAEMALIDTDVRRTFATGIARLLACGGFPECYPAMRRVKADPGCGGHDRWTLRLRVNSRATETTMTVQTISPYGC